MVGSRFLKHQNFLKNVALGQTMAERRQILNSATPAQIQAIVDTAHNVCILKKFKPRKKKDKEKLKKYSKHLKEIARAEPQDAKLLIQNGRGAAAVASILVPLLFELGRALYKRK